ncbi:MAG TPA: hypothetical protein VJL61_14810 [Rhodanobacteraceae bacterium]|nr:hypothetical protein [Rhodanobacteraceae bacterium]
MELDDLKAVWQALDSRMARQNALAAMMYRESRLDRTRRFLRPLWIGQVLQLAAGIGLIVGAVAFWIAHRDSTYWLVCGLLLHLYGLMFILAAARNFHLMGRIDFGLPLLDIQKRLATLRAWRLNVEGPVFAAAGCFMWIPLVLVLLRVELGADAWLQAPPVVWSFIACGFMCLLGYLGLQHWSHRRGGRVAEAFDREIAGKSVFRAQAALEETARFEQE